MKLQIEAGMKYILTTIAITLLLPLALQAQYIGSGRPWAGTRSAADSIRLDSLATASAAADTLLENKAQADSSFLDSLARAAGGSSSGGGGLAAVTIGGTGSGATFEVATAGDGDSVLQAAYDSVASLRPGHRTIGLLTDTLTVDDTVYVQAPYSTLVGYGNRIHIVGNIAAIIDTGGFDSWGFDGVTFIGDASAYAAFGGDNETDSVFFKNGRIEGFTSAGTRVIASDSLSVAWRFDNISLVGNYNVQMRGAYSVWDNIDIESPLSVGLSVNWTHARMTGITVRASGGVTGVYLFHLGASIDGSEYVYHGVGGLLSDVVVAFSDSSTNNVGIVVNPELLAGTDRGYYSGIISGVVLSAVKSANKGKGIYLYRDLYNLNLSDISIDGFAYGIYAPLAATGSITNATMHSGGTGIYIARQWTIHSCAITSQVSVGINIAGGSATSYGNLYMVSNGTNITDNGTNTNAGDTNGVY